MASYSVETAKHATLSANTVDTVTIATAVNLLANAPALIEVLNRGTDTITFSKDGTTPTVLGDDFPVVLPGGALTVSVGPAASAVIKLISASATAYSVIDTS